MNFRVSLLTAVTGATLLAIAAAPPAFAKRSKDSSSNSVGCLTSDTALETALGIATDGSVAPLNLTVSPSSLWPPNHKMRTEALTANLTGTLNSGSVDVLVWLTNITDDQTDLDGLGGQSCGPKTAKQGLDWSPNVTDSDTTTFLTGSANGLTDTTPLPLSIADETGAAAALQLRGERCAKEGTRDYAVTIVCCDLTNGVCDDSSYQGVSPTSAPSAAPTASEDLTVQALKSRGHHGKP
jgi:hypothetical protein